MQTTTRASETPRTDPRREAALTVLLVVSGGATLLHESAWFRMLVPSLGAGATAGACVSGGALLGLALGALAGGRAADRWGRPGLVFVAAEALGALLSLLVVASLGLVGVVSGLLRPLVATLLFALAALPLGASLPAAVRALAGPAERTPALFRRLYAWNTVGAVVGVAGGALWTFEVVGNRDTVLLAAAAQVAVAVGAWLVVGRRRSTRRASVRPPASSRVLTRGIGPAALACGAAGLVVQVSWMRRLTPALGSTYEVFAVVLGLHLAGIALGTLLLGPRRGERPRTVTVLLAAAAAVATLATPGLVDDVARAAASAWADSDRTAGSALWIHARATALLLLAPTALGAALLPWLLRLAAPREGSEGRATGRLLGWNTTGSAVAAAATALWWIPAAGTAGALRGAAGLYLASGALAARSRPMRLAFLLPALVLLAQPLAWPVSDESGARSVGMAYARGEDHPVYAPCIYFREGPAATVVVREQDGRRIFWVDGSIEASTTPTQVLHLSLLGHLPRVLLSARGVGEARVAVVGLGAGITARALASWPSTALEVYELEPAVVEASDLFQDQGGGLPPGARVRIGDGRRGILDNAGGLAVVTTDPVHPAIAGSAWLYSFEHWAGAMRRIAPEGLLVHWVPMYGIVLEDLRTLLRTFAAAVPHPYLFLAGADGILVGAHRPLHLSEARLRSEIDGPEGGGLRAMGFATPSDLLGLLALGPEQLRHVAGAGPLNEDDRLLLEFTCARNAHRADLAAALDLVTRRRADATTLLDAPPSARWLEEQAGVTLFTEAWEAYAARDLRRAIATIASRALRHPEDVLSPALQDEWAIERAFLLLEAGRFSEAAEEVRGVLARGRAEAVLRLDAAEILLDAGFEDEGRRAAADVLQVTPSPRAERLVHGDR